MSWSLVPLATVKKALNVTTTDDDDLLIFLSSAASRQVVRYLKGRASEWLSIDSPPDSPPNDLTEVPEDVAGAVIYYTGILYRNPDNDTENAFEDAQLPKPVRAMLHMLRDPALA